jgi:hypothetical protein
MKRNILTALATLILATSLQAKYKDDKIAKDDIPRNEKKLWMKIDETQEKLESSLLSGDQRFLDQLELARKKVADIMLTAEDEKKNKDAVKQLPRAWNFWKRVIAQVEIDDLNEYNLNAALGQRAPEPREEQEQRSQFVPASAYQGYAQPQPVQVVVNNYQGYAQQPMPQQAYAPPVYPQYPQPTQGLQMEHFQQAAPPPGSYHSYESGRAYQVFGITPSRPVNGHLIYEKATKNHPGYYHGSAERSAAPVSRGGGSGGHR